jgi:hypothetical protein
VGGGLPKPALEGMIDVIKAVEPEAGYGTILMLPAISPLTIPTSGQA